MEIITEDLPVFVVASVRLGGVYANVVQDFGRGYCVVASHGDMWALGLSARNSARSRVMPCKNAAIDAAVRVVASYAKDWGLTIS